MYADRHVRSSRIDPRSLTIAVLVNGAAVSALILAQPTFTVVTHDHPLTTYPVPIQPPPAPLPPKPEADARTPHLSPTAPRSPTDLPIPSSTVATTDLTPIPLPTDTGTIVIPLPTPSALATTAPEVDPAHRGDLQPVYPASELRAEHEGVVTVRVLIGVDGLVHAVERVAATSDAFFLSTRDRALARWRFRPATRGDVPVEAWRTMTIRFVIPR